MAEFAGAVGGHGQRGSPQLPEAKERRGQALGEAGSLIPHICRDGGVLMALKSLSPWCCWVQGAVMLSK